MPLFAYKNYPKKFAGRTLTRGLRTAGGVGTLLTSSSYE